MAERHAADRCRTFHQKIFTLDDYVEVYPTHVDGSLYGGNISNRLSTTIGYERRMNSMLDGIASQAEFVRRCINLKGLPVVPPYWPRNAENQ